MIRVGVEESHPATEDAQVEALRRMTGARRLEIMAALSATMMRLSRRALRRANPNATEHELKLLFIELNYGRELADRIRAKQGE